MRWTRRHPHLAWFSLVAALALVALFLRDLESTGSGSVSTSPLLLVFVFAIAALLVLLKRRRAA